MHSKPFPCHLTGVWRFLLCALLVTGLGPVPARAASAFTDAGADLLGVRSGGVAWGDGGGRVAPTAVSWTDGSPAGVCGRGASARWGERRA